MYICLHMYIIHIYRYVQRYTYFVCIHILDQQKSNKNTKGLRREIAFKLLAVRNHMISQFPLRVVFLPCMVFLVQRGDVPILKLSLLISVSFWLPQFFFQDSISRRGSLNTKTRSSWVQIKMNYAHEHRSCWIITLSTNLSPKALVFKSSKVVRSIQVRMNSFFEIFMWIGTVYHDAPVHLMWYTVFPLLQLAPGKALVERGENIWKFKSCLVRWWVLRVSKQHQKAPSDIPRWCPKHVSCHENTPGKLHGVLPYVFVKWWWGVRWGMDTDIWRCSLGWVNIQQAAIDRASTIDDKALTPRTSRCFSGIPYKMVMKRRKPCRFPRHILGTIW